jgi:hypothetical protein
MAAGIPGYPSHRSGRSRGSGSPPRVRPWWPQTQPTHGEVKCSSQTQALGLPDVQQCYIHPQVTQQDDEQSRGPLPFGQGPSQRTTVVIADAQAHCKKPCLPSMASPFPETSLSLRSEANSTLEVSHMYRVAPHPSAPTAHEARRTAHEARRGTTHGARGPPGARGPQISMRTSQGGSPRPHMQ